MQTSPEKSEKAATIHLKNDKGKAGGRKKI